MAGLLPDELYVGKDTTEDDIKAHFGAMVC